MNQGLEGSELLFVDEVELVDKVDEVLEGGVEVGLLAQADDGLEVTVVDVGVDPEEPLEDRFDYLHKGAGEGHADL